MLRQQDAVPGALVPDGSRDALHQMLDGFGRDGSHGGQAAEHQWHDLHLRVLVGQRQKAGQRGLRTGVLAADGVAFEDARELEFRQRGRDRGKGIGFVLEAGSGDADHGWFTVRVFDRNPFSVWIGAFVRFDCTCMHAHCFVARNMSARPVTQ